jgi:Integrase zinc binding domain
LDQELGIGRVHRQHLQQKQQHLHLRNVLRNPQSQTSTTTPLLVTPPTWNLRQILYIISQQQHSLSKYLSPIVEGFKKDVQFRKALVAGVESGIYVEDEHGLLWLAQPGAHRVCIPDIKVRVGRDGGEKSLRELLIAAAHDSVGHMSVVKTDEKLRRECYWKSMQADVGQYVQSCHSCQVKKTSPTKQYGKNHPLPIPSTPWTIISMDFLVNSALGDQKFNSLISL